jgi:hypothetical protein
VLRDARVPYLFGRDFETFRRIVNETRGLALIALAVLAFAKPADAAGCANGVYRAGCVGPNGAAVVRKAPPPWRNVTCANGVYRAGCIGPNGAAVVRKPY